MDSVFKISAAEVEFSPLSVSDTGRVFWWNGRLFRGIPPEHAARVHELFDCGLIPELMDRGLFVRSWISPGQMDGFGLLIEHEVIDVPAYPKEWTFSMLKDAALLVLALNEVAMRFGYQTKDCHGYNVLFSRSRPVFVDLGSLTRADPAGGVLYAFHEFMRSYYYPLQMWRTGGQYFGLRAVPRIGFILPLAAYLKYRWPILRLARDAVLATALQRLHALRTLAHRDLASLRGRYPRALRAVLGWLKASEILSGPARVQRLRARLAALRPLAPQTPWSNYQDAMPRTENGSVSARFEYVARRVDQLGAQSALEIAGNQGALSRRLVSIRTLKRVVCTDADGHALDKGYRAAHGDGAAVEWAVFDPFSYESSRLEIPPEKRFRAEAVIALALTHHLILTQGLGLAYILEVMARFSSRYVLVEFMPLGLHDGTSAIPLPDWYRESWFRREFERRFDLVERTQLEANRVLYIGTTRSEPA